MVELAPKPAGRARVRAPVDDRRPKRQDLADPSAGLAECEHERLVDRDPHLRERDDDAVMLVDRQVLAPMIFDKLRRRGPPA